jgi:hypothetical protein
MGFPASPTPGDRYTAPSGVVYTYTSYGAWRVAEGQTDFDTLAADDIADLTAALGTDAASILTKLKTVDTDASGLNAATLDSQEGAYYADIPSRLGYTPFNAAHIPAGFKTLYFGPTAPTGWTKDTTHNDKAIRLVSGGTGGSAGGTSAFSTTFAARTIARSNLPNVTLGGVTSSDGAHTHSYNDPDTANGATADGAADIGFVAGTTGSAGAHTHTITTDSINGGVTQQAMDLAVAYVDAIVIVKS